MAGYCGLVKRESQEGEAEAEDEALLIYLEVAFGGLLSRKVSGRKRTQPGHTRVTHASQRPQQPKLCLLTAGR